MNKPDDVSCETLSKILLGSKIFTDKKLSQIFSVKAVNFWNDFINWNSVHNLTKITSYHDAAHLHFLDSLFPVLFPNAFSNCKNILDLGTGGGFPGIPLSFYFNDINFHLLDKSRKKISFLRYVSSKNNYSNVHPVYCNFFNFSINLDMIISRAVRIDAPLISHCRNLLNRNGWLVVFRSKDDFPDIDISPSYSVNYTILNKNRSIHFYQF
jgi:16S rRNA (guanine527-N7)-methyltransferase